MSARRLAASAVLILASLPRGEAAAQGALLDRALAEFWKADDAAEREEKVEEILRLGASFDLLYQRLEEGPRYSKDVKTELVEESRRGRNGLRHEYVFLVPKEYDPSKKYRVCFYLHGGVNRAEAWKRGEAWWRRFDRFQGEDQISVFPSSWRGALWWQSSQIENLEAILDRIKREYNVDENRVYLFGVSDGGTGAFYYATKAPTPWAAFFPFLGHPAVLENPATGVDGLLFVDNLTNRPLFVVNGEKDELYPVERVRAYIETFERAGVEIDFRPQPGGHNTRWWNGEQKAIEAFMESHPRVPHPERLVWETERTDRFERMQWLVIEQLEGKEIESSGKVELVRRGNVVEARTRGVSRFKLLLSPEPFDFSQPLEVVVNGTPAIRANVERSSETLLRWAARDFDRSSLYAAELEVVVPSSSLSQ